VDVPGHHHLYDDMIAEAESSLLIILVIDSKDRDRYGEAGEILFDLLNNTAVYEEDTPIVIVCNKQDLQFAKKSTVIEMDLEKEIDETKRVRLATRDDDEREPGFLET
jgi:signal recognition particle receptor subunit beta